MKIFSPLQQRSYYKLYGFDWIGEVVAAKSYVQRKWRAWTIFCHLFLWRLRLSATCIGQGKIDTIEIVQKQETKDLETLTFPFDVVYGFKADCDKGVNRDWSSYIIRSFHKICSAHIIGKPCGISVNFVPQRCSDSIIYCRCNVLPSINAIMFHPRVHVKCEDVWFRDGGMKDIVGSIGMDCYNNM